MRIELPLFRVEVATPHFLMRGRFQPRGDILVFLNDPGNTFFRFDEVELLTFASEYRVPAIRQPTMSLNRRLITYVAVLEEDRAANIQALQTNRLAVFYTDWCAVRGFLHVNADTPDDDLLSEARDFYAISRAHVYPIRSMTNEPASQAPYVLIGRHAVTAYHAQKPKGE